MARDSSSVARAGRQATRPSRPHRTYPSRASRRHHHESAPANDLATPRRQGALSLEQRPSQPAQPAKPSQPAPPAQQAPPLPDWAAELVALYESNSYNQFIVHGNVQDRMLLPLGGAPRLGTVEEFIMEVLLPSYSV